MKRSRTNLRKNALPDRPSYNRSVAPVCGNGHSIGARFSKHVAVREISRHSDAVYKTNEQREVDQ